MIETITERINTLFSAETSLYLGRWKDKGAETLCTFHAIFL